ncbi:MAG: hypothetical protein ACLQUT_11050 [Thermoleophilia bacterium]
MKEHPARTRRDMRTTRFSAAIASRLAIAGRLAVANRLAIARSLAVASRSVVIARLSPASWLPARPDRAHLLLYGFWYIELCAAAAAVGSLMTHRSPQQVLATFIYLAAGGAALTMPGHFVRIAVAAWQISPATTSRVLRGYLVVAAGFVIAFLSTARGWWAIIAILLVGNALWSLWVSERETETAARPPTA